MPGRPSGVSRADSPSLARQAAFETIFVVAHDDTERAAIVGALVARGHTVLDAPPGDRAVDVLSAFPSRVHLLLVDESGLTESGRAIVSRLRAVDPLVQVLHVLSADLSASTPQASRPHLARPFTLDELTARVRHALDTGEGRSWSVS